MSRNGRKAGVGTKMPLIIISGLIISFFIILVITLFRYVNLNGEVSTRDVEKMIKKEKYYEALASLENSGERISPVERYLQKAMVWMALAWEKQNRDNWRDYGKNGRNWLDVAEADSAEKYLKEVLRIAPDEWKAHYQLGNLYMERGWFPAAEGSFMSALKQRKNSLDIRINLATLYSRMRKYELAEQELIGIAQNNPNHPRIAKNLGLLYRFYLNQPKKAIFWLTRYLNNAEESDRDVNFARRELEDLLRRYPEYASSEPLNRRKKNEFHSPVD